MNLFVRCCIPPVLLLASALAGAASTVDSRWSALQAAQLRYAQSPATAEPQLHEALQRLEGMPLDASQRSHLTELTELPALAVLPHPEGAGHSLPRYPIAWLARSLLRADQLRMVQAQSAHAARRGAEDWIAGLQTSAEPDSWLAGLEPAGPQAVAGLIDRLRRCAGQDIRCADSVLRFAGQFDDASVALALPQASAQMRVRFAASAGERQPSAVVQAALGGLADTAGIATQQQMVVADLRKSVPELALLADPARGADVAAALATRLDASVLAQLQARFESGHGLLEQQRVLLALRLSPDPQMAALAQTWVSSPAALPGLQRSAASW